MCSLVNKSPDLTNSNLQVEKHLDLQALWVPTHMHEFVDAPEIVLLPSGGAVNSTSKKKMFCMGIAVTVQLHKIFDGMPEVNIPGRFLTVNVVDGTT